MNLTHVSGFENQDADFEYARAVQSGGSLDEEICADEEIAGPGFAGIVGQSAALLEVLQQVEMVVQADSTVLLLGETGTGKELIASVIHERSRRKRRTLVKVNRAAIPSGLLESDLFGHERGAYTGALTQKIGRLELADQGSLFLDEIGDIPLELQPKLLRVLQEREFERLAGSTFAKRRGVCAEIAVKFHVVVAPRSVLLFVVWLIAFCFLICFLGCVHFISPFLVSRMFCSFHLNVKDKTLADRSRAGRAIAEPA